MKKLLLLSFLILATYSASFAQAKSKTKSKQTSDSVNVSGKPSDVFGGENGMMSAMNSMGPMISNMAKSMMDAQLEYYKQPGKLVEIAKLQKQYFDALVKEGFTEDQALKIITSDSLLPKGSGVK